MKLKTARVILTGATGGIGIQLALALARHGAHLILVQRSEPNTTLLGKLRDHGVTVDYVLADLATPQGRAAVSEAVTQRYGGIDVLINNAAVQETGPLDRIPSASLERLLQTNLVAPILLTRALLPGLLARGRGHIVNIGSTFGAIGFPYFSAYCAAKFGLRGFSEALRRELAGSGVQVTYVAPRATQTALNSEDVVRMNAALKVQMDKPSHVAGAIIDAIRHNRAEVHLGWPERFFARLNAVFPRIVDAALRKQRTIMRRFIADH